LTRQDKSAAELQITFRIGPLRSYLSGDQREWDVVAIILFSGGLSSQMATDEPEARFICKKHQESR